MFVCKGAMKLAGAPVMWDERDFTNFLTTQQWTDLKINHRSKASQQEAAPFFTGISPNKADQMEIYEDGLHTILISTAAALRRAQAASMKYLQALGKKWGDSSAIPKEEKHWRSSNSKLPKSKSLSQRTTHKRMTAKNPRFQPPFSIHSQARARKRNLLQRTMKSSSNRLLA